MVMREEDRGFAAGVIAFMIWGGLVLFWRLLDTVPASEILSYRVTWSFLFLIPMLALTRRWNEVRDALADKKVLIRIFASAMLIGMNWFTYIWAVNNGRILETSLGYFMTPLFNVAVGHLMLGERSSRLQIIAVGIAGAGVLWALIVHGQFPWVGVMLSCTFTAYGYIRKTVHVEALPGLFLETLLLLPLALGWILWLTLNEQGFLVQPTLRIGVPLMLTGILTAIPLVLFAYAARHVSLSTLGFVQYLSPTGSFLIGIYVFHEPFAASSMGTFACIWVALALHSYDSWRSMRLSHKHIK